LRNLDFFIRGKINVRAKRREKTLRAALKVVQQNRPKVEESFLKWVSFFSLKATGVGLAAALLLVFFLPRKKPLEVAPKNEVALDQPVNFDINPINVIDERLVHIDFDIVLRQDFYSKMKMYKKLDILKKWNGKVV
jgi:hypothetical protein